MFIAVYLKSKNILRINYDIDKIYKGYYFILMLFSK